MSDLVLPAFEMDCRDWIVVSPDEVGLPEDVEGAPVLAALSTILVDGGELLETSAVLTVGLFDGVSEQLPTRLVAPGAVAQEVLLDDVVADATHYVMPAPGRRLAVLAEFAPAPHPELQERIEQLMVSFRWQADE